MWKKGHASHLVRAVFPGVIGASLHDHLALLLNVTSLSSSTSTIFAFDHYHVVEGLRAWYITVRLPPSPGADKCRPGSRGLACHRHDGELAFVGLARLGRRDRRRRLPHGIPHLVEIYADVIPARRVMRRRRTVRNSFDRIAVRVVTGKNRQSGEALARGVPPLIAVSMPWHNGVMADAQPTPFIPNAARVKAYLFWGGRDHCRVHRRGSQTINWFTDTRAHRYQLYLPFELNIQPCPHSSGPTFRCMPSF